MSLGKHFINGVTDPVDRSLRACLYGRPDLRLIPSEKVLYRQHPDGESKVLLLSGGGSGHEPAYAGYIGDGMLDIAVAGNIFASPSASQVGAGLRATEATKGTLMIVKNYTGDKLNFGLAAEKAKADGRLVNVVFVNEDASVQGNSLVGQRGLAGTVFVLKVAGALAARGADLADVTRIAQKASDQIVTAAASLDRCSVPNRGKQDGLPHDEMEYGMGIHNEPGVTREKVQSFETIIRRVVDMVLKTRPTGWSRSSSQEVAVMVNNLGGLSVLEMGVITDEVLRQLLERGIRVVRIVSVTFLTSLDGPGFSLTLMGLDEELKDLLDAPTTAEAWPRTVRRVNQVELSSQLIPPVVPTSKPEAVSNAKFNVTIDLIKKMVQSIAKTTKEDEPAITEYDTIAGDGDCGETLLNGVNALIQETENLKVAAVTPGQLFRTAAMAAEKGMGGTSGAIYAIFLNAAANALDNRQIQTLAPPDAPTLSALLSTALVDALHELYKYTLARRGHRTLMDALIPFVKTFQSTLEFDEACEQAREGAEGTMQMEAAMGRASYVGREVFAEKGGIPDPGAWGVVSILRGIQVGLHGLGTV